MFGDLIHRARYSNGCLQYSVLFELMDLHKLTDEEKKETYEKILITEDVYHKDVNDKAETERRKAEKEKKSKQHLLRPRKKR